MRFPVLMLLLTITGVSNGQTPAQAIDAAVELNSRALAAQKRIDSIYSERLQVLSDINTIEQDGSVHALLNREIEQQLTALKQNMVEIDDDLRAITETQTGIMALLNAMVDALEQFIELDLPFATEQRLNQIQVLRTTLKRADIDVTGKYQSVVSAYLTEIRYGHNHAVTQQTIETPDGRRVVDVLRLGRAGLWYVTPDHAQAGRWDSVQRLWTDTDTDASTVRQGIKLIRESATAATLPLPIQVVLSR